MRSRSLLVAGLAAVSLVASGCGDSSDSEDVGASGLDGEPIAVGVICACTSTFDNIGPGTDVARAWAKWVNSSGGIEGHPVQLTVEDDAGNPGTSATAAQTLIADQVDVILDLTPVDSSWADAVSQAGIPVVGGELTSQLYYTNPDFYPSGQTNDSITYANVLTAKQAGATTLGQLYCAEAPSCQESVQPHKEAGDQLGVPVVYSASISASAPNFTAQCVAAKQAGVTALIIAHVTPVISRVTTDCDRQDYHPIYIAEGTGFETALASAPGARDSLWEPFPVLPFFADQAPVKEFRDAVDAYDPHLRDADGFAEFAAQAWTGGLLIGRAVSATGLGADKSVSAAQVIDGLDSLQNETLDGWSPPLTFTAGQPHSVGCWFTVRVTDGTPALVDDGALTCQDGSKP